MSAVAGVIGKVTTHTTAEHMLATMRRRGPCAEKYLMYEDFCFMHTSDHSIETIKYDCAGESYILVYDGKLYNGEEVKKQLVVLGHCFKSASDEEIILHAYVQWGEKCLDLLNGVFSFAIWRNKDRKLFVARDRIGVKPLFYRLSEGCFIFASEIKMILTHPGVSAELDSCGIVQLLMLGPGRIPGSGVLKGIHELKPGYYGVYFNGTWREERYWALKDTEHSEGFDETAEHVRSLLLDAIHKQTKDVQKIGTFLSGGLDSSIISSVCADIAEKSSRPLYTFSVDYENNDRFFVSNNFQPESDRYYIDLMKHKLGSQHLDVFLSADDLIRSIDDATIARDLPGMADVDFSLLAFSKHIFEHVSVVLSGECADEIFGGYMWYTDPQIRSEEGFPWARNALLRASFIHDEYLNNIDPKEFIMDQYKTTIKNCDILPGTSAIDRRIKELVNLNFAWFMQTLLDRNDRMTMYHGLQVRVPFCDYRIAEYLYSVPWEFKHYGEREKGLLRYAMGDVLPQKVLYRKKSPFPKTYDPEYLKIVTEKLQEIMDDPNAPLLQLVRKDSLEKLITTEFTWPWYGQLMKLPQTIAYMLQINRWLTLYNVNIV